MSKELTVQVQDINTNIIHLQDYPAVMDQKLIAFQTMIETIGDLTNDEKRNDLNRELKDLKSMRKIFKDKRLNVTRVLDDIKKNIMAYEAAEAEKLESFINNTYNKVLEYDKKKEQERIELQRAKEEEIAIAQAEADAKNQRQISLLNGIGKINGLIPVLQILTYSSQLTQYTETIRKINGWKTQAIPLAQEFGKLELLEESIKNVNDVYALTETRLNTETVLTEEEKEQMEANARVQAALAEERMKQERIEAAEEEERKFEEQQERLEELKKLKEERLKNLRLGFDIEIEDIDKVPDEYVKKSLDKRKARQIIKSGTYIPGLIVTLKDGTVLTKDELEIL